MELGLFITICTVFLSYLALIFAMFGTLPSISDSSYEWKKINNLLPSLFTLFIWGISIPYIILGVEHGGLFFLSGALLSFVGASPWFKDDTEGRVHTIGATGGIIAGFAAMWVHLGLWYLTIPMALFSGCATYFKLKNKTMWIEILAFSLLIYGLGKGIVFI